MEEKGISQVNFDDPRVIETIKRTVAVGATDAELAMFLEHCKATGLNPFRREVWFVRQPSYTKRDGTAVEARVQIMTGVQGYLAVANSHPMYDGMESMVERDEKGFPVRAVARVHRKDRKFPAYAEALWSEDSQPTTSHNGKPTIWGKMPSVMLSKVAKSRALREAFAQQLNGTYTSEEMPAEFGAQVPQAPAPTMIDAPVAGAWRNAPRPADTLPAPREFQYDLALLPEAKREAAQEYLDANGALLDPDTGCWVSKKELKKMAKAEVRNVIDEALGGDDLPGEWGNGK